MTARELYASVLASIERYYSTVTSLNFLDWPIRYIAISLFLCIGALFVATIILTIGTLVAVAVTKWLREFLQNLLNAVGIGVLLGWFDKTFGVRLGGTLFILLVFILVFALSFGLVGMSSHS